MANTVAIKNTTTALSSRPSLVNDYCVIIASFVDSNLSPPAIVVTVAMKCEVKTNALHPLLSLSPNCHPFIPLSLFFVCVYLYLEYFLMTLCVSLRRHIYQFKLANETILVDSRMRDKVCDVFIFFLQRVVFFPLFTSSLAIITTS